MSALAQEIPAQPEPTENLPVAVRAQRALAGVTTESALTLMADKAREISEITNKAGYDQCHSTRMELRGARIQIEKAGKAAREDATNFSKAVIAEEKRLVAFIAPEEERLGNLQEKWDADRKAEKEAAAKAEAERVAKIRAEIDRIKARPTIILSWPSTKMRDELKALQIFEPTAEVFAEFLVEAQQVQAETIAAVERLLAGKEKAEHEAALTSCRETIRKTYLIPPGLAGKSAAQVRELRDKMAALDLVVMDELHAEADQARAEALAYLDDIISTKTANEQAEAERRAQEAKLEAERAELRRQQEERERKAEAERKRQEAEAEQRRQTEAHERQIRDTIASTRAIPTGLISASSVRIRQEAARLAGLNITQDTYGELVGEMESALVATIDTLNGMAHAAEQREQQEAENKARQEELDRQEREAAQRREQEERDRQAEQEREEAQRRGATEAERRAKEAREQAEREAAEAARTRLEKAAPKLLKALQDLLWAINLEHPESPDAVSVAEQNARAAIAEATGT